MEQTSGRKTKPRKDLLAINKHLNNNEELAQHFQTQDGIELDEIEKIDEIYREFKKYLPKNTLSKIPNYPMAEIRK